MTDLELTKKCADAMGLSVFAPKNRSGVWEGSELFATRYDPLHDDAQAMQLVKKFRLDIYGANASEWGVQFMFGPNQKTSGADLNRAIVECVAKMKASK